MGLIEILWLLGIVVGIGLPKLPLSLPPLPPDQVIERAAPDECLLHVALAGMARPAAGSANRVEALLAEAEVQRFIGEMATGFEKLCARQEKEAADFGRPRVAAEMRSLAFALLTRPAALTVDSIGLGGGAFDVTGSLVVNCGAEAEKVRQTLDRCIADVRRIEAWLTVEEFALEGSRWSRFGGLPADAPEFAWGFKDGLFLAAVGPEGLQKLLARLADKARPAPAWKTALEKRIPLERRSILAHLDVVKCLAITSAVIRNRDLAAGIERGLGGLRAVQVIAGLTAAEMASATILDFDGEPRGFFAPGKGAIVAADLRAIPADATMAQIVKVDLSALLETGFAWMDGVRPGNAQQPRQALEQVRAVAGFDVDEHLLQPLGDTFTGFVLPGAGPLGLPRCGLIVALDDAATFAKTHKALLAIVRQGAAQPGMPPLKLDERKVGETPIFTMKLADSPLEPAWCIHGNRLLAAVSADMLGEMIGRKADAPALADTPAIKALFGDRMAALGYQEPKAAVQSLGTVYDRLAPLAAEAFEAAGVEPPRLPAADLMARHLQPSVSVVRRDDGGDILAEGRTTLPLGPLGGAGLGGSPTTVGIAVGLMLPAVQTALESARVAAGMRKLRQLALAMHNHEAAEKALPAAAICDGAGKPLLSWRVRMLPYLDEQDLYEQFKLDEPWDSEHNKKLVEQMPEIFTSPGDAAARPGTTRYLVPTGAGTIFAAPDKAFRVNKISDGLANTILIVESDKAVPWTKPEDLAVDLDKPHDGLKTTRTNAFMMVFADGHVGRIPGDVSAEVLAELFTPDRGERVVVP